MMQVYKGNPRHIDPFTGNILSISHIHFISRYVDAFELNCEYYFSGGLAETTPADGSVGPLFACIIKKQVIIIRFAS